MNYRKFIETRLKIVDKQGEIVPFILNEVQSHWIDLPYLRKIELKARQQGFSSAILAKKMAKFILQDNRYIVTIADNSENATGLLERVKFFIKSYEETTGVSIPFKYNSKYELYLESSNNRWIIGTAENPEVGRSKTITDLHLSEAAFYRDLRKLFASALQAVVPDGEIDIETTANGFGEFKTIWEEAKQGLNGFNALFYKASDFYTPEFLEQKKRELGYLFPQEYPETDTEAFISSGNPFFDRESMKYYLDNVLEPTAVYSSFYDFPL